MIEKKPTILIVDDEKINVDIISRVLQKDYDLKVAHNGEKALKAVEKFQIDLILLDIQMPVMDGYEVAERIRANKLYSHIPIIFVTSNSNEHSIVRGFDIGGNDYITKPFNVRELKARVNTHMQFHQMQLFLEMILNNQPNIVTLTDGAKGVFINKTGLNFFGFETAEDFFEKNTCICHLFLEQDNCFHLGRLNEGEFWIDVLDSLSSEDRHVAMRSIAGDKRVFHISIQSLPNSAMHVLDFNDVTNTVEKQTILESKVMHDSLTGAYSREFFQKNYQEIVSDFIVNGSKVGLAILDIDHFKDVNDNYGHDVGDRVLIQFVERLKKHSRQDDFVIRWGGEEFLIILKVNSEDDLQYALEHFRSVIENEEFETIGRKTCSIGGSCYHLDEDIDATVKRADEALYRAKNSGRNMVVI
jgi:diguanylate cyclase (GGDEF)-like protein